MIPRIVLLTLLAACGGSASSTAAEPGPKAAATAQAPEHPEAAAPLAKGQAEAIFASGCFWCAEKDFEKLPGVIEVVSGYAGGSVDKPSYKLVGTGLTGHTEAIRVIYDPKKVTYAQLLDHFWHHVDFTDGKGQFCDRGSQYRPAIFPLDDAQRAAAEQSKAALAERVNQPIAVELETPGTFWVAEAYHQDFYKLNPTHYQRYRTGCGRDARVAALWAGIDQPVAEP